MPLKAVSLECGNNDCDANQRGERTDGLFRVGSLDELQSGTVVDELCRTCGQQLRIAFSAPRLSFGRTSDSAARCEEPQSDGSNPNDHKHLHLVLSDDPGTEALISLETGQGWLRTQPGSKTHREMLDRGVEPEVRTLTPIPPDVEKSQKDLN